jgi:hypothetical protein
MVIILVTINGYYINGYWLVLLIIRLHSKGLEGNIKDMIIEKKH